MGKGATAKRSEGRGATHVQSPNDTDAAKPHFMMGDPGNGEGGEAVVRIGIDPIQSDAEFLERLSSYRNAMAKARGVKMRRQWTRKTLAESLLSAKIAETKDQLRAMIDACGPLPDPEDEVAVRRYVEKVIEWDRKVEAEEKRKK